MNPATPPHRGQAAELRQALRQPIRQYRAVLLFSIVSSLLVLVPTFFMLEVYDRVLNSRNGMTLAMLLLIVVVALIVMEWLELLRTELLGNAALQVDAALRERLFDSAFAANLAGGGGRGSTQLFNDLKTLREFLPSPAVMAMLDAPASLIFLLIVTLISPWLGLLALAGAAVQVGIGVRAARRTTAGLLQANRAAIEAQAYASSVMRQSPTVEAMGMGGGVRERWLGMQRRFLRLQAKASDQGGVSNAIGRFVQMLQGSLILGAACWLSLKGSMLGGGGMMIVASILGARVLIPLAQLVANWRTVVNARDAYDRIDAALAAAPKQTPGMALAAPEGHLSVEAVAANAPGSAVPILRGLSFAAHPGEVVVVVGPSGAGKTTLTRVLTGVWPALSGKVRLDGADVYQWDKQTLGPHMGYLAQGVELFDGTLAENIARFGEVDMDKVWAAAEMVGLGPMIDGLDKGCDTPIGQGGAFLSGGQRQRVGLARAVYGLPRVVVLDEPNSSLDEAGDLALLATLRRLKSAGSTSIVVSHRASVLLVADKVLVMRHGQTAMFGPRDEVIAAMRKVVQGQTLAPMALPAPVRVAPTLAAKSSA